jgi:Na+-translocating ferredoxin:NAD+ oxidoreductase subunit G
MKKLESNLPNMVIVLTVITLLASFLLASVYGITKTPIAVAKERKKELAIKNVLPVFDRIENDSINGVLIYKGYQDNSWVGTAIESSSKNGFSGDIKLMVGFDATGAIYNYSVLEQKETPGLGTKIVDWFRTSKNNQSIIGKHIAKGLLKLSKDGGEIDAITASTISSRAFLEAVNEAYSVLSQYDTSTGATPVTDTETAATPWVENK